MKTLFKGIEGLKKDTDGLLSDSLDKIAATSPLTPSEVNQLKALKIDKTGLAGVDAKRRAGQLDTFHKCVFNFFSQYYSDRATIQQTADEMSALCTAVNEIRGRLMNNGAHHGEEPLYESELQDACRKVHEFQEQLFVFTKHRNPIDTPDAETAQD
ncbi:hypothetical protein [Spirosoma spitsbergense]|uniref:hypothetical protein n=1 Tax=Spirosoma spitsbergense TaxID=431554 RepID=UPI0003A41D10|nr:hypothetical protein [Spirosoma spitsbergense]